ncbi:MAG: cytochrome c [Gemmataceae bacterium]
MKRLATTAVLALLLLMTPGSAQRPTPTPGSAPRPTQPNPASAPAFTPKFEVVGETRLLMEGLAHANYRSLAKLLRERPTDLDTWVFARGQAILVAETGNLLLLRPPRNSGRDIWMKLAMAMRGEAAELARAAGTRDYTAATRAMSRLTDSCNRCHTTFRVPVRVSPKDGAADPSERDVSSSRTQDSE